MKKILEGIFMITQLSITMMVPIFLGVFAGLKLRQWLSGDFWFIFFLVLGILAAFRNAWLLIKGIYFEEETEFKEKSKKK